MDEDIGKNRDHYVFRIFCYYSSSKVRTFFFNQNILLNSVFQYVVSRSEVTHVIVPTDTNSACSINTYVMQGILQGKWILNCNCEYVPCTRNVLCLTFMKKVK
jgi:hypothetical protein